MSSSNISRLDDARDKHRDSRAQTHADKQTYDLIAQIDELEDTLEVMDEFGLHTRDDLESLIARLEAKLDAQDPDRE